MCVISPFSPLQAKSELFDVIRRISRVLLADRQVTAALVRHYREWQVEPTDPVKNLASILVQLRFILRQILLVTPKEAARRAEYIERAEKRGTEQAKSIQQLADQLATLTRAHNRVVGLYLYHV